MRRHYFAAWFVMLLGIWATGLNVFAQERQDLQGPPGQGGFFDSEQQTWVDITDGSEELMQQLNASEVCQDTFLAIPSEDDPRLCISFIRRGPTGYQDASLT